MLPRVQLFEVNDLARVPAPVRDTVVESLARMLAWGRVLAGLVDPFETFLTRAGSRDVLDLGSGAGGPASILLEEMSKRGLEAPRFHLTDLHPRPQVWAALRARHGAGLDFEPESVDATAIPAALSAGRVRTLINVFHHFPPELARAVLHDAVRSRSPVFLAEGFERNPLGFASMWPAGLPAMLANPVLSPHHRLAKIALTWLTPAAMLIGLWDGLVSTLRVYSESELRAMVADAPGFEWTYGRYRFPFGGVGYYFAGLPSGDPGVR